MSQPISRRVLLKASTAATIGGFVTRSSFAAEQSTSEPHGYVVGEPTAEAAGARVLADGGNVADALVAAALVATVAAPNQTGVGGYGAHAIFAFDHGQRIAAIDANSAAPAAMTADFFKTDADGKVPGRVNETGWLAAGVPGILAGLQLALTSFGTRSLDELVQPAIALAREGFSCPPALAAAIRGQAVQLLNDPGSRKIFFHDGKPISAGDRLANPDLAELLQSLGKANSVEAFYRGDVAKIIAAAFQAGGGLVTQQDFAKYQARLVEPITLKLGAHTVHTCPLTAGGLTVLQALAVMQALDWPKLRGGVQRTHAAVEAMRLAWRDRLTLLGDPDFGNVPAARLLSADYARDSADRIQSVVKSGKFLSHAVTPRPQGGTINLSAADRHGNFGALTLTHGEAFGARVTVDGLGLTLGHGMSRFDLDPSHPNAPGPGKRPLNNMTPTIVTKDGRPVLAAGGRGGRRIPNAMLQLLAQFVILERPLSEAIAALRMHGEGNESVEFEPNWPTDETAALAKLGYQVKTGPSARLSAVSEEHGVLRPAMR